MKRTGDGLQMVFVVTATGSIKWAEEPFPVAQLADFSIPGRVAVDAGAGWDTDGRAIVVSLVTTNELWLRTQNGTSASNWGAWAPFTLTLYDPDTQCSDPDASAPVDMASVTVSRWEEGNVPVVFVTDSRGNVYYATKENYSDYCVAALGVPLWHHWKSFYHTGAHNDVN